jgi:hypothetical protein
VAGALIWVFLVGEVRQVTWPDTLAGNLVRTAC